MGGIALGTTEIEAISLGTTDVLSVSKGTTDIWSATSTPTYSDEVLADSPLAYWKLDESTGSVTDATGNGWDGSDSGVTRGVDGHIGNAVQSTAVDQYVTFGSAIKAALNGTSLTIEAWVKTASTSGSIVVLDPPGTPGLTSRSFVLGVSSGKLVFSRLGQTSAVTATSTASINDNAWHHVAVTYDGAMIRLYLDGAPINTAAATGSTLGSASADLRLFVGQRTGAGTLIGLIDDAAIYTSVLSAARIAAHYSAGAAGEEMPDPAVNTLQATVPTAIHNDYGASYPLTYEFSIPTGSSGLTGQWRASTSDAWTDLTEPVGRFDGVAAARFDYANDRAYLSVPFTDASDDLYVRVVNGGTIVGKFVTVTSYYDDRACPVVVTYDDWHIVHHSSFVEAAAAHNLAELWMSPGINAGYSTGLTAVEWAEMQTAIDGGYVEPTNHGLTHKDANNYVAGDATTEVIGGATAITDNVTMPPQSRKGVTQYVQGFIEPYGRTNTDQRAAMATGKYLSDRIVPTGDQTYAALQADGVYTRQGASISRVTQASDHTEAATASTDIMARFDADRAAGRLCIIYTYPHHWPDRGVGSSFREWIDYVASHDDIWSVGWGHLYQYRRLSQAVSVSTS